MPKPIVCYECGPLPRSKPRIGNQFAALLLEDSEDENDQPAEASVVTEEEVKQTDSKAELAQSSEHPEQALRRTRSKKPDATK